MPETSTMLHTACPHCRRRYRVPAHHVPPRGIRARCPHCGAVFPIVPSVGAEVPVNPPDPVPGRPEASVHSASSADPELARAAARVLARALASDLKAYNPLVAEAGAAHGDLVRRMHAEIARSWQHYVREVGPDMAANTDYFREALNEFLAEGKAYF